MSNPSFRKQLYNKLLCRQTNDSSQSTPPIFPLLPRQSMPAICPLVPQQQSVIISRSQLSPREPPPINIENYLPTSSSTRTTGTSTRDMSRRHPKYEKMSEEERKNLIDQFATKILPSSTQSLTNLDSVGKISGTNTSCTTRMTAPKIILWNRNRTI